MSNTEVVSESSHGAKCDRQNRRCELRSGRVLPKENAPIRETVVLPAHGLMLDQFSVGSSVFSAELIIAGSRRLRVLQIPETKR